MDSLGHDLALSANGDRFVVGAPLLYDPVWPGGLEIKGGVFAYEQDGGIWQQMGQDIFGDSINSWAGISVDISANGDYIAYGAPQAIYSVQTGPGNVEVLNWNGNQWERVGRRLFGDTISHQFGYNVSLSDDANVLAVSSRGFVNNTFPVKVYEFDGVDWTLRGTPITFNGGPEEIVLSSN